MTATVPCPTCGQPAIVHDTGTLMGEHMVTYHRCVACGMIFLPEPHWLDSAYSSAISHGDVGLLRRSRILSNLTAAVIRSEGLRSGSFLDWAGGYGTLTQMMRDRGYDYRHHDEYADPVFARDYLDDGRPRYDLISAFEVVEHLTAPVDQLRAIAGRTDLFLFSTRLLPEPAPRADEWWYFDPASGQHVSFHTVASLSRVGRELGFALTTNGTSWHLFHRAPVRATTRALLSPAVPRALETGKRLLTSRRARPSPGGR